jgi:hypothetical protein
MANRGGIAPNPRTKFSKRAGVGEIPMDLQSALSRTLSVKPSVGKPDSLWSWVGVNAFPEVSRKSDPVNDPPAVASLPCLQELFDPVRGSVLKTVCQLKPLKPTLAGAKT